MYLKYPRSAHKKVSQNELSKIFEWHSSFLMILIVLLSDSSSSFIIPAWFDSSDFVSALGSSLISENIILKNESTPYISQISD